MSSEELVKSLPAEPRSSECAQHSVHPTGGSLRVFNTFRVLELVPLECRYPVPPTSG